MPQLASAAERAAIDPEARYPAAGLRVVERRALEVLRLLPGASVERTRDVIQLSYQGPMGIVALVTPEALELRFPTREWTLGLGGPAASSVLWRRVSWERLSGEKLARVVSAALRARQRQLTRCRFCGEHFPPELRVDTDVCYRCAERELGIIF